jgi:quercetin dioxygenase-like cupin family protein
VKITTRTEALTGEPMDLSHFSGPATSHPLHNVSDPGAVRVSVVHFEAGTRNHWHRHSGGQVLHVVDGEGYVQARGEPARHIRTGDIVSAAPGEEHWHGAGPDASMAHVAVSIGDITWLEPSDSEPIGR